ncbi:hypothetical protein H0E87_012392, partial [Populus deltoides]
MLKERRKISIIGSVTTFAAGSPMGARAMWRSCNNDSILLPFSLGTKDLTSVSLEKNNELPICVEAHPPLQDTLKLMMMLKVTCFDDDAQ